jgi:hypothetical protein
MGQSASGKSPISGRLAVLLIPSLEKGITVPVLISPPECVVAFIGMASVRKILSGHGITKGRLSLPDGREVVSETLRKILVCKDITSRVGSR